MIQSISTSSLKMVTAAFVAAPLTLTAPAMSTPVTPTDASLDESGPYSFSGASWLTLNAAELATRAEDPFAEFVASPELGKQPLAASNLIGSYAVGGQISLKSMDVSNWLNVHPKFSSSQRIAEQEQKFQKAYAELHNLIPEADQELLADAASFFDAIQALTWKPVIWSDEGEVAFEWKAAGRHAIVSFDGGGTYGYAMLVNGKFKAGAFELPSPDTVPSDLLAYLDVA